MRNQSSPYFQALEETLREAQPSLEDMFFPDPPGAKKPEPTGSCEICGDPLSHGKLCGRCKFIVSQNPSGKLARMRPDLLEARVPYVTGHEPLPGDNFDVSGEGVAPLDKQEVDIKAGGMEYDTRKPFKTYGPNGRWEESIEDELGDTGGFEEPDPRCAICGKPEPDDLDYYKPKREGWPKVGPLCSRCYHQAADEERQSEEYFYKFYYYNTLAPHIVRESIEDDIGDVEELVPPLEMKVRKLTKAFLDAIGACAEYCDTGDAENGPSFSVDVTKKTIQKAADNVIQDLGIDYETIEWALQYARKHGIQPDWNEEPLNMRWIEEAVRELAKKRDIQAHEIYEGVGDELGDTDDFEKPGSRYDAAARALCDEGFDAKMHRSDPRNSTTSNPCVVITVNTIDEDELTDQVSWVEDVLSEYGFDTVDVLAFPSDGESSLIEVYLSGEDNKPLNEGIEDEIGDVSEFEAPNSVYFRVELDLQAAGFDATVRVDKEGNKYIRLLNLPNGKIVQVSKILKNLGVAIWREDKEDVFIPGVSWGMNMVFDLKRLTGGSWNEGDPLIESKEKQYRGALNETRRWHEGEPTLGDMRKNNAQTALEPVDDSEPIPPPPEESAAPDMGDVGDFQNPGSWNPEEQSVIDKFNELFPELGTAGAITRVSQDMGFPYAAAHAIISSYLDKFNDTGDGEDVPHTEQVIPQGIFESNEGFGRSETGPLGREEEPDESYEDLDDVSDFDSPAGRYGTPLDIKVTLIGNEYHARLFADGKLVDEKACKNKEDIGWMCREMMRWYSKMGGDSAHAENARDRHNEEPADRPDVRQINIHEGIEDEIGNVDEFDTPAARLDQEYYDKYLCWLTDDEFEYLGELLGEDQFEAMTNQEIVGSMPDYMLDDIEGRRSAARKERRHEGIEDDLGDMAGFKKPSQTKILRKRLGPGLGDEERKALELLADGGSVLTFKEPDEDQIFCLHVYSPADKEEILPKYTNIDERARRFFKFLIDHEMIKQSGEPVLDEHNQQKITRYYATPYGMHESVLDDDLEVGDFEAPELGYVGQRVILISAPRDIDPEDEESWAQLMNCVGTIKQICDGGFLGVELDDDVGDVHVQRYCLAPADNFQESVMDPTDEETNGFAVPLGKQSASSSHGMWEGMQDDWENLPQEASGNQTNEENGPLAD